MNFEKHLKVSGRLLAQVTAKDWRWQPVEGAASPTWELVQDGMPRSEVYALGEVLSAQARVIAAFTPAALLELSAVEGHRLDAAERLEQASMVLRRHLGRCYRLKQREHYDDLVQLTRKLAAVLVSLGASAQGSELLLEALEESEAASKAGKASE